MTDLEQQICHDHAELSVADRKVVAACFYDVLNIAARVSALTCRQSGCSPQQGKSLESQTFRLVVSLTTFTCYATNLFKNVLVFDKRCCRSYTSDGWQYPVRIHQNTQPGTTLQQVREPRCITQHSRNLFVTTWLHFTLYGLTIRGPNHW